MLQLNLDYVLYSIYNFFVNFDIASFSSTTSEYWSMFRGVSTFFSALFITGIVFIFFEMKKLEDADAVKFAPIVEITSVEAGIKNEKWKKIMNYMDSMNVADWRMAILEADIILDEMTTKMGYIGDNLGEKLKSVEKSDFTTVDKAWEAHKIRNTIAHEGSDYVLTNREARRIIGLYEEVFKEFYYI